MQPLLTDKQRIEEWHREEACPFAGWDFSHLADRWIEESPPWSYETMVGQAMASAQSVLDLGTGGGERLLEYRDLFPEHVAATEGHAPNLRLARERLDPLGVEVHESQSSLNEILPFEDGSFDLVIDRHTGFNISEIERVLTPGGTFLTQQVDGNNLSDLSAAFDCQQPWTFFTLDFCLQALAETHLTLELAQQWQGKTTFTDVGALVYYLKAVPWTVEGFSIDRHLPYLLKLQRRIEQEGALTFTQKLMILQMEKP